MGKRLFYCTDCGDFHSLTPSGRCSMCHGARIMDPDGEATPMTDSTEADIVERLRLTEGGLELLLVAAKAGDPQREIIWRIEEELRQIRRPFAVIATEGGSHDS